jgi:signal peptidase II
VDSVSDMGTMPATAEGTLRNKVGLFVAILTGVLTLDIITKYVVQRSLLVYEQRDVIGEYLRLTYIHNTGAAFGIQLGPYSREIFLVLSLVALLALAMM